VASWSGASAVAVPQRERAAARPAPPRRRAVPHRRRLTGGIAWIVVLAFLLAGVVALNVGVLRLNITLDDLDQQRRDLQAQNAALASQLSSSQAAPRIQTKARRAGYVPAPAEDTTYVELTGR
jgi:hypothetical protein